MTSTDDHGSCKKGKTFRCMHSDEAIKMLLANNPTRYSIKEIATLTNFHRNTTKKAIDRLDELKSIGSGNYTNYYLRSITDHYRIIIDAIASSTLLSDTTGVERLFEKFGYNMVENNLNEIITKEYTEQFTHDTIVESLLHLKMSYPFVDLEEDEQGELKTSVDFHIEELNDAENEVILRINPCLCQGDANENYCNVVIGALKAGLELACQMYNDEVTHEARSEQGCLYRLKGLRKAEDELIPISENEQILQDFL